MGIGSAGAHNANLDSSLVLPSPPKLPALSDAIASVDPMPLTALIADVRKVSAVQTRSQVNATSSTNAQTQPTTASTTTSDRPRSLNVADATDGQPTVADTTGGQPPSWLPPDPAAYLFPDLQDDDVSPSLHAVDVQCENARALPAPGRVAITVPGGTKADSVADTVSSTPGGATQDPFPTGEPVPGDNGTSHASDAVQPDAAQPTSSPLRLDRPAFPSEDMMVMRRYQPTPTILTDAEESTTHETDLIAHDSSVQSVDPTSVVDLRDCLHRAAARVNKDYRVQLEVAASGTNILPGSAVVISTTGSIDDGCMEVVMGHTFYQTHQQSLGELQPTNLLAQVADSRYRPFLGQILLDLRVAGVSVTLRALCMHGDFTFFLGRPWLHATGAVHLYALDWLYLRERHGGDMVPVPHIEHPGDGPLLDPFLALEALQSVPTPSPAVAVNRLIPLLGDIGWEQVGFLEPWAAAGDAEHHISISGSGETDLAPADTVETVRVCSLTAKTFSPERIERRAKWGPYYPFKAPDCTPQRAQQVLDLVSIGNSRKDNLTADQVAQVQDLVVEFQHVFGLTPADLASNRHIEFDIDVDPDVKPHRSTRVPALTDADREWLVDYCTKLLDVQILRPVDPSQVTWCSEIKIVPKGKGSYEGVDVDSLRDLANHGLKEAGLPFDPYRTSTPANLGKWIPPSGRRLVHNYVPLNWATRNVASFPTRSMDQKVKQLAGHQLYSSLDMMSGYFAIKASSRAQSCLTFFVDGLGYLTYTRMPFGPSEGPTRYNLFGSKAFGHLEASMPQAIGGSLVRWFDDINTASDTFQDHLQLLRLVFETCEDTGAVLSPAKSQLFTNQVMWCGNIIDATGVASDPNKVAAIVHWPIPRTPMDVIRFVNTTNFFRTRIPKFAEIVAPLSDLTALPSIPNGTGRRKGQRRRALLSSGPTWQWTDKEEKAFRLAKAAVAFAISSAIPDFKKPWHIHCDASPTALAAALLQEDPHGHLQVLEVASRKCAREERPGKMTQFLRELVAMRFGLDKFEQYIKAGPIIVSTDCIALRDLLNATDMKSTHLRWRESLMGWPIVKFLHRPGPQNLLCDGLSRCDTSDSVSTSPIAESWIQRQQWAAQEDTAPIPIDLMTTAPQSIKDGDARLATDVLLQFRNFQDRMPLPLHSAATCHLHIAVDIQQLLDIFVADPLYPVLWFIVTGELQGTLTVRAWARRMARSFFLQDAILFHTYRDGTSARVVTASEGSQLAKDYHDQEGHFGRDLILAHFRAQRLYWWNMRLSVESTLLACVTCQSFGPRHIAALLGPVIHPQPFDLLAADFLKLSSSRTSNYVLVVVDYFSRFVWAYACPATGQGVVDSLTQLFTSAVVPRRLLTDNGSHFLNKTLSSFLDRSNVSHSQTPVYAPWVNGLVERHNGLLVQQLRKLCLDTNCDDWPLFLHVAVQHLNRRVLPDLGYRPQELLFGIIDWGHGIPASSIRDMEVSDECPPAASIIQVHQTLIDYLRDDTTARRLEAASASPTVVPTFRAGQLVMLRVPKPKTKLAPLWTGPYVVSDVYEASVSLDSLSGSPVPHRHHFNNLKPFYATGAESELVPCS